MQKMPLLLPENSQLTLWWRGRVGKDKGIKADDSYKRKLTPKYPQDTVRGGFKAGARVRSKKPH